MNKFTKLLSVFAIAGAIGTGIAGAAGCTKGNSGEKEHDYQYTVSTSDSTKHVVHCKNDNHEGENDKLEDHTWGTDDKCVCGATKPATNPGGNTPGGETPATDIKVKITNAPEKVQVDKEYQLEATVTPDTATKGVTWSIDENESDATATVSETGLLKATSTGAIRVVATSKDDTTKKGFADILVINQPEYDRISKLETCIIDSAKFEDATSLSEVTTPGTKGVYTHGTGAEVSIASGVATSNGGGFYIDFGTTKDIVEGTLTVNVKESSGTGFGMIRIMNRSFANTDDYMLSGRDNGYYRINRGTTNLAPQNSGFSLTNNVPVEVYFKIDKATGTGEISYDGIVLYKGALEETDVVGIGVFGKAASAANTVEISNVAIATYEVSDEIYITGVKQNVEAINTAATALKGEAWTLTSETDGTEKKLGDAKTAVDTALAASGLTRADAKTAYETYETAVLTALKAEYKAKLAAAYPSEDYTTPGTGATGNKGDYDAAIGAADTAFDGVTKVADFAAVYKTHNTVLSAINKDPYYAVAECTVTVSDGSATQTITGKRVGDTVTKDELLAKVTVPAGQQFKCAKIDGTAISLPYTLTDSDTTVTITVEFEDLSTVEYYPTAATDANVDGETDGNKRYIINKELIDGTLWATSGMSVDSSSKKTGGGETGFLEVTVGFRLKTNGTFKYENGEGVNALKLVLPQAAKVTVFSISGNSTGGRDLVLYNSAGTATTDKFTPDGSAMTMHTYNVAAGTWYIGSASSGINIYRIIIDYSVS